MTVWRRQDGSEWGAETTTAAVKGTIWGPGDTASGPEIPEAAESILATADFPCHVPGCDKVAKSAAGLAAHARSHK